MTDYQLQMNHKQWWRDTQKTNTVNTNMIANIDISHRDFTETPEVSIPSISIDEIAPNLKVDIEAIGESSTDLPTDTKPHHNEFGIANSDIPSNEIPVVGFGDIEPGEMSEKDLDSYLEQLYDPSIELNNTIPDELQEALSSVSITNSHLESNTTCDDTSDTTSSITSRSVQLAPKCDIQNDESTATVTSDDMSGHAVEPHLRPFSDSGDSRRGSGESIEKFLNPTIASPTITTPMEDTGFSKIPGFAPGLSSMAEGEEPVEKAEDMPDQSNSPSPTVSDDVVISNIHVAESLANTIQNDTNPDAVNTESTSVNEPVSIGGDAVMECVKPAAKTPTSPGLGARPKELGIMTATKKNRPNSLLGLSTPDLNAPSPIVVYPPEQSSSSSGNPKPNASMDNSNDAINMQLAAQKSKSPLSKKQMNLEIQQQIVASEQPDEKTVPTNPALDISSPLPKGGPPSPRPMSLGLSQPASLGLGPGTAQPSAPQQTADIALSLDEGQQGGLIPPVRQQRRPNSLNLSFNQQEDFPARQAHQSPATDLSGGASPAEDLQPTVVEDSTGAQTPQSEESESNILPVDGNILI